MACAVWQNASAFCRPMPVSVFALLFFTTRCFSVYIISYTLLFFKPKRKKYCYFLFILSRSFAVQRSVVCKSSCLPCFLMPNILLSTKPQNFGLSITTNFISKYPFPNSSPSVAALSCTVQRTDNQYNRCHHYYPA